MLSDNKFYFQEKRKVNISIQWLRANTSNEFGSIVVSWSSPNSSSEDREHSSRRCERLESRRTSLALPVLHSDFEVRERWNASRRIVSRLRFAHCDDSHRHEDISPLSSPVLLERWDICRLNRDTEWHRFPTFELQRENPLQNEAMLMSNLFRRALTSWMLTPKLFPSSTLGIISWIQSLMIAI